MTTRLSRRAHLSAFFDRLAECRDKNELTHGLHPYPAKFIPHIPRKLIEAYVPPRTLPILDPMCGSGTTLVEAAIQGFHAIGIDLNPIATLAARAKTLVLSEQARTEMELLVCEFRKHSYDPIRVCRDSIPRNFLNRDKWFSHQTLREVAHALKLSEQLDPEARVLVHAVISSALVALSNQESETRWCAKARLIPPGAALKRIANRLEAALLAADKYGEAARGSVQVLQGDARCLPLPDNSVGMIVTSPPYANSHDYYLYNKLRMFVLGFDVARVQFAEIGSRNRHSDMKASIEHYRESMGRVMYEWRRVLRPTGYASVVVGDAVIRGEFFDMGREFVALGAGIGFKVIDHYSFSHRRFNTTFQRGFGTAFEKRTHVIVFQ